MKMFPLKEEVMRAQRTTFTNRFGDEIETEGEMQPVKVFGWYLPGAPEGQQDGHVYTADCDAVIIARRDDFTAGDRVELPELGEFFVHGDPGRWDNNPWWSSNLTTVQLKKVRMNNGD